MRVTILLVALLATLLSVNPVAAQDIHPCDDIENLAATIGNDHQALKGRFCQVETDAIDAVTVYANGKPTNLSAFTKTTPAPNAGGLVQYEITLGTFPTGKYSLQVSNWNKTVEGAAMEGPLSNPFVLSVVVQRTAPHAPQWKSVSRK